MTTAGLHCHHKIATILYMREMEEVCVFGANSALQHASFDVAGVLSVQELLCSPR